MVDIQVKQEAEDKQIKLKQLSALLMILGSHIDDIEDEEARELLFMGMSVAEDVRSFLDKIRSMKL